jgi:hypothetical protein
LLSHIISVTEHPLLELPARYNWSRYYEENPDALIYHLHGEFGRSVIRHQMSQLQSSTTAENR